MSTVEVKKPRKKILVPAGLSVDDICNELGCLQRYRTVNLKSRIMIDNRLVATVAIYSGYHAGMDEKERMEQFDGARKTIARIKTGEFEPDYAGLVHSSLIASDGYDELIAAIEKKIVAFAKLLPVAEWVSDPQQAGFGIKSLGVLIGETGNLANYSNPGKLWRRMGLAPYTSRDKTLMGATWKSGREGKLSADEWTDYGYSPRRRSITYIFGENIVKQNKSIYRARYDSAKLAVGEKHPERIQCSKCEGTAINSKGRPCSSCKGTGEVWKRAHLHGMLLATKLLLKNLWIEWNPGLVRENDSEGYVKN